MTRQEQRSYILEQLSYLAELSHEYFSVSRDLEIIIADAMEIDPVDWSDGSGLTAPREIFAGYKRFPDRKVHAYYRLVGFRVADYEKIRTVISRMAAQGYIRISKSGRGFKVLRTSG